MAGWSTVSAPARERSGLTPEAPLLRWLRRGSARRCGEIGCEETLTARCIYVDRFGDRCPTFWCRHHLRKVRRKAYCAVHVVSVATPALGGHAVATAVDWMGRAIDDDMVAMLRSIAAHTGENLLAEETRFAQVGLERIKVWERTWKTYSAGGAGCRINLAIEDRQPDVVKMRVNSTVVTNLPTPWALIGTHPHARADQMAALLVAPAKVAIEVWAKNTTVQLRGSGFIKH